MIKTYRYNCSSCTLIFNLEEDYDDACPCCGEFQLERIHPNDNDVRLSIDPTLTQDPPKQEEQS